MRLAIVILATVTLCTGIALAEQPREQRSAGMEAVQPLPASAKAGDCAVGNLDSPVYNYGNWIMGADSYAYLVQSIDQQCDCPDGFQVNRVYMMMQFAEGDVPENFSVSAGLAEAVWDEGAGVYLPGQEYCTSAVSYLSAPTAGLYDVYVDLDGACPCATSGDPYFLVFHLPDALVWWADALEDNTPDVGVSYYDGGLGWKDLVADFGWWGNNILHAEVGCCSDPVGSDAETLDGVKALFR